MRVLVLCDDNWHPAQIVQEGLEPLRQHGFEFDYVLDTGSDFQLGLENRLREYPLLVLAKSNRVSAEAEEPWITPQAAKELQSYVSEGGGLLVLHSGTVGYKDSAVMRDLVGGVFTHHPEQCPVAVEPVPSHPITRNIPAFDIKDEHYFMDMTGHRDLDVFLTTSSEYGQQPGGWTREQGAGRVCVLTPGHHAEVWKHPAVQQLLRQSLEWCKHGDQGRDA
ncbi:ThuA domain-containing protein [Paenibacillus chibensis]|uniref:ThuA domain-containing protein n=1 Tax=Paenibacillus chibensis TaxID=59846 RepID=UPI0013E3AD80|nr:ThuA domain-containing protein [Paenibacillus chibensis]MEC0370188.1 ThuA domain-containing protein [Paenibacillus chibensis]